MFNRWRGDSLRLGSGGGGGDGDSVNRLHDEPLRLLVDRAFANQFANSL